MKAFLVSTLVLIALFQSFDASPIIANRRTDPEGQPQPVESFPEDKRTNSAYYLVELDDSAPEVDEPEVASKRLLAFLRSPNNADQDAALIAERSSRRIARRSGGFNKRAAAMGVDLPDYILHINKGRNFDFSSFREKMQKSG